ncbi:Arginine kinase [Papilio machaon]|uniref:Arginine kinase n=1 Tax=Papilio machaon TaxID=76193 RepID=A0A194RBP5_PAPMA|nr:Arginine kinase [Papilio machaon]
MDGDKKRIEGTKKNGLYVHYSCPKVLGDIPSAQLRQWLLCGAEGKLERAVLQGQGHRLLAEADSLPIPHHIVQLIATCDALHAAVEKGSLLELKCCDAAGVGLLHKAVFYTYMDIVEYLVNNYPQLVQQRDSEGRTALHYTAACRAEAAAAALLEGAGAARGARDCTGRTPAHYRAARTLLALPAPATHDHHVNMPRHRNNPTGLAIKRHNIRIWCHECDMGRLQRVVWEGHGTRLLTEVSSQSIVKRFLEAVPYIMNTIRDVHNAVIQNDLEGLMRLTADPIPSQVFSSRDVNGMTALHKAAGLGHNGIVKYIIEKYPQGISDVDNDGRTPLHYAAIIRDEQHTYNTLVGLGADESVVDNKNKTPGYYINRPQEIDKNTLKVLPDAPRTPSSAYPTSWDWKILDIEHLADFNKKSRKKNLKASNENISSKNNTSTLSETVESQPNAMKNSNTHELINTLPELDDTEKSDTQNSQNVADDTKNNEASEVVEEKDSHENTGDVINEQEQVSNNTLLNGSDNNQHTSVDIEEKELKPEDKTEDKTLQSNDESTIENEKNELSDVGNLHEHENIPKSKTEDSNKEDNNDEKQEQQNEKVDEIEKLIEHKIEEHNEEISVHANITDNESMKNGHETSYKTEQDENSEVHQNNSHETDSNVAKIEVKEQDTEINREDLNCTDMKNSQNTPNGEFKSENQESESDSKNSDLMQEEKGSDPVRGPEGNINSNNNEDDDDVQVQEKTHNESQDIPLPETKGVSDLNSVITSAKGGKLTEGRNTQESLIEGLISSEPEQDSQDASITQKDGSVHGEILVVDNEIDPEVTELINSANMEMLATLVLNGEGSRLIGRRSQNVELQSFLENVPMYMEKINRVHIAAKEGNIRDLQTALDRRKFAIARDPISPNGATPLHVATVFGKTNIIKYLGGRFPETLSAVDFEGRTALHYAAVIPDNGHYFNLLQQLGANAKDLDDNGRSAEDYLHHPDLLPYEQLLNDYDISEDIAQNMLADKVPDDRASSRRNLETPEALDTIERCYRLLASARPTRTSLSASSNKATPTFVLGRFLNRPIFEIIRHRVTRLDHDLFDVIWPAVKKLPNNKNIIQTVEEDFPGGVTAPDYYVYEVFHEFLLPLIKDIHNINISSELPNHPSSDFESKALISSGFEPIVELNVDPSDDFVLSGTIECSRNLCDFELPINLKVGKLEAVERILTTVLLNKQFSTLLEQFNSDTDQKGGTYYTLNEVLEKPSEICAALAANGVLVALCDIDEIDDCTRLHGKHWPYGRGVFVNDDKTIAIWINVHDHLRVLISTPTESPGEIGKNNAVNGHIDIPVFHTEEGRYLAKSLGDPLIKGLTEVANVKPKDPVAYLASFLHNFPENEKPRLNTQESNVVVTSEAAEVDNDQPPPQNPEAPVPQRVRSAALTATRPRPIDVITLEPKPEVNPDAPEIAQSSSERDEHGQSMLHFAAARTHANNALFQLLQECDVSLGYRDELYRTARDVAIQANVPENTVEIDKWVLHLAARGKSEKIMELLLQGYDHILDVVDDGVNITEVVAQRGDTEMINLLASIPGFEESRESLHNAVRRGDLVIVRDIVSAEGGRAVARAHNAFGRTALHVAVLAQHEDVVAYLAETCPELLRIGDNLERTPLHYAMGVDKIESLSRVLIRAGAKRVLKDLKGRQPSYYFMNKSDILRLKEEEEAY